MILLYVLTFCRIVIALVFGFSSVKKMMNMSAFEQTIIQFDILPRSMTRVVALFFLIGECVVALFVTVGGPFLKPGFYVSILLLIVFCTALISVLRRHIRTSCNCFGSTKKMVSTIEVWRNVGFLVCACIGCLILAKPNTNQTHLSPAEWGVLGLGAALFWFLWLHLDEIVQLFQQE
jgi:hypothetical protein